MGIGVPALLNRKLNHIKCNLFLYYFIDPFFVDFFQFDLHLVSFVIIISKFVRFN